MHDSVQRSLSTREEGKAFLMAAILASVAVCGIAAFLAFFLFRSPEAGPGARPGAETLVREIVDGEAPDAAAGAQVSAPTTPATVDSEPSPAAETRAKDGGLRITGTVKDKREEPLAEIHLRWLPVAKSKLQSRSHDIAALGKDADPVLLSGESDADLRHALTRSLTTSTDAGGTYELHVPLGKEWGVVVASGPGYEMQVRRVHRPEAGAEAAAEVPEVADAAGASKEERTPQEVTIDFALGPAGSISGALTDKLTGEPVQGMAVVAGTVDRENPAMFSMVAPDAPSTVARADGTYRLDGLPPGEYRVVPRTGSSTYPALPSSQGRKVPLESGAEVSGVDFQVSPGGRIRGEVTGPDGKPFPGARCSLIPTDFIQASMQGEMEWISTVADQKVITADGRFEFQALPLGKGYRVFASAEGLAPAHSDAVQLSEEAPEAEVHVSLSRGCSISGQLTFKDGRPAPGKDVNIVPNFSDMMSGNFMGGGAFDPARNKANTDDAGNFTLKHLAAGDYTLSAGKLKPQNLFSNPDRTTTVKVDGQNDVTGVQVVLEEESETGSQVLGGIVVNDRGSPIEGASVRVTAAGDFTAALTGTSVETGADGRFSAPFRDSAVLRVLASKSGHASASLKDVEANARELTITLPRHGTISGRVIGPDGQPPPPGGKVKVKVVEETSILDRVQRLTAGGKEEAGATLSEDGTFSIEAPPGQASALAAVPGYAPGKSQPVTVPPGGDASGVEIRLSVGAMLEGRVTLGTNAGVERATVTVKLSGGDDPTDFFAEMMPQAFGKAGNSAVTNNEGYYELQHLAAGTYTISASHAEYAGSEPVTVTLKENSVWKAVPLVLSAGGKISGGVTEQGKPRGGMMVQLMGVGPVKQAFTSTDGRFEFRGLKTGEYLLNVMDMAAMQKGKIKAKSRAVVLEGEETAELEVAFGVGYKVRGKVRGLPAAPMRMVTLRRPGGPNPEDLDMLDPKASVAAGKYQTGLGMVTPEDEYEIEDIEPGEYILEVPRMPADPTDLEAYKTMDRRPLYRKDITVEKKDLELDIEIK